MAFERAAAWDGAEPRGTSGDEERVRRGFWPKARRVAGKLPKVNYSESFTRGDNPVYVFGSLLTQHQFMRRGTGAELPNEKRRKWEFLLREPSPDLGKTGFFLASTSSEIDDGSGFGVSSRPSSGKITRKCRK